MVVFPIIFCRSSRFQQVAELQDHVLKTMIFMYMDGYGYLWIYMIEDLRFRSNWLVSLSSFNSVHGPNGCCLSPNHMKFHSETFALGYELWKYMMIAHSCWSSRIHPKATSSPVSIHIVGFEIAPNSQWDYNFHHLRKIQLWRVPSGKLPLCY